MGADATGTYTRKSAITVAEACDEWLARHRGIRRVTLQGYTHDLKPVRTIWAEEVPHTASAESIAPPVHDGGARSGRELKALASSGFGVFGGGLGLAMPGRAGHRDGVGKLRLDLKFCLCFPLAAHALNHFETS